MSFPRYPKYKPSGVEWLGDVPEHWDVKPLKYLVTMCGGGTPSKTNLDYWDGDVPWASAKDLKTECLFDTEDHITQHAVDDGAATLVPAGSLLIVVRGMILVHSFPVVKAQTPMAINQDLKAILPQKQLNVDYLAKLLRGSSQETIRRIDEAGHGTKALRMEAWTSMPLPVPHYAEQTAIATFLDRETGKIDELVAEQRRLMELLKEKRQADISHAVTKGLNPHAPLKPSGIQWLGDVPEHWDVGPVKRFFTFLNGRRVPLSSEERGGRSGEFPYYGASGIIDWIDEFIFDEDLVLVSEDGANLVNRSTPIAFVARGKYWVNNHAHILKAPDANVVFWAERIEAIDLNPFVTGSAQPKFTAEALGDMRIAVPPTDRERAEIERFIVAEAAKLNALITEAERAIELLQERRTALISAAVTGKIDVRGLGKMGVTS